MKIRLIPKRKLRAATTARRMPRAGMEDYAQEPNMSFAKAIVVVVVLHLVAVAGICTFSKARNFAQQSSALHPAKDASADPAGTGDMAGVAQPAAQDIQSPAKAAVNPVPANVKSNTGANTPGQTIKPPINDAPPSLKDSGVFYTVAKGDTPVSIAKKLHVAYDDLLKLNKITDPKKLKIGEKLRVPAKKKPMSQA